MLFQRDTEGGGRGEEAFLEQLEDELGGHALAVRGGLFEAQRGIGLQGAVGLAFLLGVGDLQVLDDPFGEAPAAVPAQFQLRLHPPNHDGIQLIAVGGDGTGEALAVEQFQQSGKALPVAVVGGGGEEQLVLEMRGQQANGQGAHGVGGVLAAPGGGDVVGLVNDQQIIGPRVWGLVTGRQGLTEGAQGALSFEVVDGGYEPREVGPGVDVDAALAAEQADRLAVDDAELQPELVAHLLLPLHLQRRRADDQYRAHAVTEDQLLNHQTRLDGLAEPDVIGNQQIDPRHGYGPHHRIELVLVHLNAAAEGRLQGLVVGLRDGAPAHGIQEGLQAFGVIEGVGIREPGFLIHRGPWLQFPENLQFLAEAIVFYGGEPDQGGPRQAGR